MWFAVAVTVLTGYLLGNLNGAVSISALFGHDDVRDHGSGNAGLTNFVRQYGFKKAGLVVAIDVIKAVAACLVGQLLLYPYGLAQEGTVLGGIAVTLGHDFPALLGFRGGKGILSGVTIIFMIDWRCGLIALGVFALCVLLTRYVSLGSVCGAAVFGIYSAIIWHGRIWMCAGCVFLAVFAIVMHRANLLRLIRGTEHKFSIHSH